MSKLAKIRQTLTAADVPASPASHTYISGKQGIYEVTFDARNADDNAFNAAIARNALKAIATTKPSLRVTGRAARLSFVVADES